MCESLSVWAAPRFGAKTPISLVEESQMVHQGFDHFGELYRAAFAEPNLERKLFLLGEVRNAMERWQQQQKEGPGNLDPMVNVKAA